MGISKQIIARAADLEATQSEKNQNRAIMKQYFGNGPAMIVD
jgi:hypothetical protein